MGWSNTASFVQNFRELSIRNLSHVQLEESGSEGSAHGLTPSVSPGWILSGKQHEMWVRLDHFVQFWDEELLIIVQQPAYKLQALYCDELLSGTEARG